MKPEIDRFSSQAKSYAKFRPVYPQEFYDFLFSKVLNFGTAWDCGTGNGQVAIKLAERFEKVHATDISNKQIQNAFPEENIQYAVTRGEATDFAENTFDLITVGQAIHWFDFDAFYKEVMRVAKPNAIVAIWGYGLHKSEPPIDKVVEKFYLEITRDYWDKERSHIDHGYSTVPFPFEQFDFPAFSIKTEWKLENLVGYLNSWSASANYQKEKGENPVKLIEKDLQENWNENDVKEVVFPMFGKLGWVRK